MADGIRSRKVRAIVRLEARAHRLIARAERGTPAAEPARRRAEALLKQVRALELALTDGQLAELRRRRVQARACLGAVATSTEPAIATGAAPMTATVGARRRGHAPAHPASEPASSTPGSSLDMPPGTGIPPRRVRPALHPFTPDARGPEPRRPGECP
jgi:hypothetical protein